MDLLSTLSGSLLEGFFPTGWDLAKIDACCSHSPVQIFERQRHWSKDFQLISCDDIYDFNIYMGHEIALCIKHARDRGKQLAIILPAGPMGMYRWTAYFLRSWNVDCSHVHGFNMDEWSDSEGNTLASNNSGSFQFGMEKAFYGPLGEFTVPLEQRHFATKDKLPTYSERIHDLKVKGASLLLVHGIGRVCHIAFWEPHFAAEYPSESDWRRQTHRLGAKLHPLTIEQNALTSFKSRSTLVSCYANTIGPGIFLQADYVIGGCDGVLGRGMQWQGMPLWMTLRYGPNPWVPSSYIPTLPGKLFFLKELAGPLEAEIN